MEYLTNVASERPLSISMKSVYAERPSACVRDQGLVLLLAGLAMANSDGDSGSAWLQPTFSFLPDSAGGVQHTARNYQNSFSVEEWEPFVLFSSIFDRGGSVNAGLRDKTVRG